MNLREILQNLTLAIVSILLLMVLGDLFIRMIIDPVNYLQPVLVLDETYGHKIKAGSAGHDNNGFRNKSVPTKTQILAIGDSNTYGVSAPSSQSWPAWLEKLSGMSVYNAGLGGYGPVQYLRILEELSSELSPDTIIIGFYLGNDIVDANRYSEMLELSTLPVNSNVELSGGKNGRNFYGIRKWLSENSMIYQIIKHSGSSLIDDIRYYERKNESLKNEIPFISPVIKTIFNSHKRLKALDLNSDEVMNGFKVIDSIMAKISMICKRSKLDCKILLIPTKELVYFPLVMNDLNGNDYMALKNVTNAENLTRKKFIDLVKRHDMVMIDVLEAMRSDALKINIYPSNAGGHPNGYGYRSIAGYIYDKIKKDNMTNSDKSSINQ